MRRARLAATGVAVLLALVAGAGPAAGAADPAPYDAGPFAARLCPDEGVGAPLCSAHRETRAALQGMDRRASARADGASCEEQGGLWVCFGVDSLLAQRGGTTYGDTFVTGRAPEVLDPGLVAHELEHARQWRLFGPSFAVLYLREGSDACSNYFEEQAGLDAGGYGCTTVS